MNKNILIISTLLMAFWTSPVFAYIDPGSGSAIMSAVIGFFLAVSIAIKTYWYKLKSMLGLGKSNAVSDAKSVDKDPDTEARDG